MLIAKNKVVSLQYELYDDANELIDKPEEPLSYLHGGYDGIFDLVEEALEGKTTGDSIDLTLEPEDAFGDLEEELIRVEDVSVFPSDVEAGMMFEADDPQTGETLLFRVVDIADGKAVVDANHPLAGMTIRFKATVSEVRDASEEEIQHGHVHGAHWHQHH